MPAAFSRSSASHCSWARGWDLRRRCSLYRRSGFASRWRNARSEPASTAMTTIPGRYPGGWCRGSGETGAKPIATARSTLEERERADLDALAGRRVRRRGRVLEGRVQREASSAVLQAVEALDEHRFL